MDNNTSGGGGNTVLLAIILAVIVGALVWFVMVGRTEAPESTMVPEDINVDINVPSSDGAEM